MRHLLLIEAAHYAKPNTRPLLRERRARVRRLVTFEADNPEAWRVSFRCFLGDTHARTGRRQSDPPVRRACVSPRKRRSREERWCAGYSPKLKFYSAWPLALRAEAMLRAFNNPELYARRLAARLHATPHRAASLTRHPPNLPHVIDDFVTLREHASIARRRFESG